MNNIYDLLNQVQEEPDKYENPTLSFWEKARMKWNFWRVEKKLIKKSTVYGQPSKHICFL
jgi:hypothetical protein